MTTQLHILRRVILPFPQKLSLGLPPTRNYVSPSYLPSGLPNVQWACSSCDEC